MAIEVGNVFEGRVTGVKPFGAFVALPEGRVGMVHISEVSNEFVQDINTVLHDGDEVKVQVINIAPDGKIALSIKRLLPPAPRQPREGRPAGPRPGGFRNGQEGGRSGGRGAGRAPREGGRGPAREAAAAEPSHRLGSQGTQAGLSPVGQVCFFGTEQKGTTMPAKFELIAPCFFGCESTAKFELTRIGAENIRVEDGRLSFCGGAEMIAAANLNLRTVERVMLLLARYKAATFDELFDGVYSIPWEEFLPADAAFPVTGSSLNSQLTSIPACQSVIKKAVVKRLMKGHRTTVLPESGVEYKVRFMLRKNVCEIMLDTTGEGLHKRGYRRNAMEAPLRETLAATIADLGRVRRDSLVEDPFCGSGTLLIEAAQKAMNIAPGLKRRFAAERYSFVPAALWAEQRQKALAESKLDVGFEAFGYDIDPAAVAQANANAKLAGVENRCHFEVADVATFAAKPEAIVLTNPPYGERLGTIEGAAKLARTLGQQMEASPCAGLYAITADMDFEVHYGKRANKRRKMYNGMIPCQLYMYYNAPKTEKMAKPMPKSGFDGKRTHFEKK